MRFRYLLDPSPEEIAERERIDEAIHSWWKAFEERAEDLDALFRRKKQWDLPEWIRGLLDPLSPRLMWEFGPGLFGGHRLVITAESEHQLRPLVAEILERAPKIDGWEFYPFRIPEDFDGAKRMVLARKGERLEDMRFVVVKGDFHCVDFRCLVPKDYPEEKMKITGFVALETLLGEEILERWVGCVDFEAVADFPKGAIDAGRVLSETRRLIDGIIESLPVDPQPGLREGAKCGFFELEPDGGLDDYPARKDLVTQVTAYPAMHRNVLQGRYFDSARYSKCGEIFGSVKIDGTEELPEWGFQDREEIENALIQALDASRLGCVVGAGAGLRYSYVDVALLDVPQAIPIIRETLARGGVSERSWIIFFDSDLSAEWIGIHPDSPPPPT